MVRTRGLYDGENIRLLEKLDLPPMTKLEVYLEPIEMAKRSLKRQFETMKKGFDMGKILTKSRDELHER